MKRLDISRFYPPGYDYGRWNGYAAMALAVCGIAQIILYSSAFSSAYGQLDWNWDHTRIVSGKIKMAPFADVAGGCWAPLVIFALYCVLWAVLLRLYFSQYSNSIYIMRRLSSNRELAVRCLAGPAAFALCALALSLILMLFFRLYYNAVVPDMCKPL